MTYKALYLSPMIPSFNVRETILFFKDIFQFTLVRDDNSYAILQKDHLTIHLLNAGKDIGQMEFYLEVDNVNAVWSLIKDKVVGMKVKEPFNREYGMREIHIEIPHTNTLMFVGQVIKQ